MKHLLTIFVLLLALTYCTTETDRNRMRAGLDSINVRNNHSPLCLFYVWIKRIFILLSLGRTAKWSQ